MTFISQHTGGNWQGSVDELAVFVRTEFTNLVPVLLNSGRTILHDSLLITGMTNSAFLVLSEICVAIVTFSGQTDIVEGVVCPLSLSPSLS